MIPDKSRLGNAQQLWSVERLTRSEGPAAGAQVWLVRNPAGISFEVLLDRALDIGWADAAGMSLAWRSPRGNIASDRYEAVGNGWTRTFPGGLLTTCGLQSTGAPSTVDGVHYPLHGSIAHIPVEATSWNVVEEQGRLVIEITGRSVEAALGHGCLSLERTIRACTRCPELEVLDVVTNEGFQTSGHMFRHHFNLGYPLVDQDAAITTNAQPFATRDGQAVPRFPWILDDLMEGRNPMGESVVYCRCDQAETTTRIQNPGGAWVEISHPSQTWPYLVLWRDPRPGVNVFGIEPSMSLDGGRAEAEQMGTITWLEPHQSVEYRSKISAGRA